MPLKSPNLSHKALLSNLKTSTGLVPYGKLKIKLSLQFFNGIPLFHGHLEFSGYEVRSFGPLVSYTSLTRTLT
jgi:hypothetical protein